MTQVAFQIWPLVVYLSVVLVRTEPPFTL